MAALNMTTFAYALKELYPKEKIEFLAHKNSQLMMRLKKDTNFTGEQFKQPVQYGHGAGVSHTFSTAQTNRSEVKGTAFTVTQAAGYSVASIKNQVVLNSRGNEGALLSALQSEMDGAISNLSRQMAVEIIRDSSGAIGVCTSITSGVVVLATRNDVNNFFVGQKLVTAASITASLDSSTADTVLAIDRAAGTVTVASSPNGTYSVGQIIFAAGDYVSASDRLAITGLETWITSSSSPAALFGVTRTTDVTRLSGVKLSGATGRVDELVYEIATRCAEEGGSPNLAIMSYGRFNVLQQELGSKVQYVRKEFGDAKVGTVGFSSVVVPGPAGDIEVVPERFCKDTEAFVLSLDSLCFRSAGPAPHIDDLDGRSILRESDDAALQVRVQYFGNLVCSAPGWNGVIYSMPAL